MARYLGSKVVEAVDTPYANFSQSDWAMLFIEMYGQFDGEHHKTWVLDQVSRILKGSQVIINLASWDSGLTEFRLEVGEPTTEYLDWRENMLGEKYQDGSREYDYDEGIAP